MTPNGYPESERMMEITNADLKQIPFLECLTEAELDALRPLFKRVEKPKGTILFRQGEFGNTLFFLLKGRVRFTFHHITGDTDSFEEIGPHQFFGEVAVFTLQGQRTATAEVTEDLQACELNREDLMTFLRRHPDAVLPLLGGMAERLRRSGFQFQRAPVRNLNELEKENLTRRDHSARKVARFAGSLPFLLLHGLFFAVWVAVNGLYAEPFGKEWIVFPGLLGERAFDPYPYHFLGVLVGVEALVFSCFVLMNQYREDKAQARRNDQEYQVNLEAKDEVAYLHTRMDDLYTLLQQRLPADMHAAVSLRRPDAAQLPSAPGGGESQVAVPVPTEGESAPARTES